MKPNGLVAKLFSAGIAEQWTDEIRFTNRFFIHVALFSEYIRSKGASVRAWQDMLKEFDSSMGSLSDEEVKTIITLLDYVLENVEVRTSTNKR